MAHNLNVALYPMELKWGEKEHNLRNLESAMARMHPDTELVILPETFTTGFPSVDDKETIRAFAERNTGETVDFLKALAYKYNVAIAGSFIADSGGLLFNRAFFVEPTGDEYFADKRHLFSMAGENKLFSAGISRMKLRYRGWNISMVVCYDIRFPVWCRNTDCEYDLLIVCANWPKVRIDAWNKLLPARAIENLSYLAAVNCSGVDLKGFEYGGDSYVYDFKGKEIGVRDAQSMFIYASLSRERLEAFREKFPAWRDRDTFQLEV